MITISMVMQFLGGLGLFLYGVNITSDGLQKLAANRLRLILESLTKKTWLATIFGMAMTVALQSSTATAVMVVEFVNSRLMTLAQALGVALGSAVGSSIVIQLISFKILNIALAFIFVGFILFLIVRTPKSRRLGQAMIGFGCIFVGMNYLSSAFSPLKDSPEVFNYLSQFGNNPFLGIVVSIVLTAMIQSSAAFLAILISLSSQGLITIEAVIPLVMGAHIGGTVTTLFSSLTAEEVDAKRVAIANSIYRVFATILLLPFFAEFAELLQWSSADLPRQVANAHLFSAALMVVVFFPFNKLLAKLLIRIVPQKKAKILKPKYLTKAALELPVIALSQAHKEVRWLAHRVLDNMLQILPRIIAEGDQKAAAVMEKAEQEVDWYYLQLTNFLTSLFSKSLTRQQILETHDLQLIAKEFEYIADNLVEMARAGIEIRRENLYFSGEGQEMYEELYIKVSQNYLNLLAALDQKDKDKIAQVIEGHKEMMNLHQSLQESVIFQCPPVNDISENNREQSYNAAAISDGKNLLIDLINWMFNTSQHILNIANLLGNRI